MGVTWQPPSLPGLPNSASSRPIPKTQPEHFEPINRAARRKAARASRSKP